MPRYIHYLQYLPYVECGLMLAGTGIATRWLLSRRGASPASSSVGSMQRPAVALGSLSVELQQLLLLHGCLWGTDAVGQRYAAVYVENVGVALFCLGRPLQEVWTQSELERARAELDPREFDAECARRSGQRELTEEPVGVAWGPGRPD